MICAAPPSPPGSSRGGEGSFSRSLKALSCHTRRPPGEACLWPWPLGGQVCGQHAAPPRQTASGDGSTAQTRMTRSGPPLSWAAHVCSPKPSTRSGPRQPPHAPRSPAASRLPCPAVGPGQAQEPGLASTSPSAHECCSLGPRFTAPQRKTEPGPHDNHLGVSEA